MKVQSAWRLVSPCISRSLSPPKIIRFLLMVFIVALLGAMGDGAFPVEIVTAATTPQTEPINPHSDLIFRATGATSCMDCHRTDRTGRLIERVSENATVQTLRAKAKGIHGPGRFADCLRCYAGGERGVEKYKK